MYKVLALVVLVGCIFYIAKITGGDNVKINVLMNVSNESPTIRDKSMFALTGLSKSKGHQKAGSDYVLGLYDVEVEVEVDSAMNVKKNIFGSGLSAKGIDVTIEVSHAPIIWIASELSGYSCSRKVVLEHEMKHHKIALDGLRGLKAKLEASLKNKYLKRKDFSGDDDVSEFLEGLTENIKDEIVEYVEVDVRDSQDKLDTKSEYASISGACDGAIQQIIGKNVVSF